jgi:hypothetical protein
VQKENSDESLKEAVATLHNLEGKTLTNTIEL